MMANSRKDKRFISCPVCGRILMKCQGVCDLEITCGKCNSEIVALVDEERVMVLENHQIPGRCRVVICLQSLL